MAKAAASGETPVRIKKYANRRLYNTATSSYVTLDHLSRMVKDGIEFVVTDAKSGEDITRSVLTQIIFEEESKGQHLLPLSFLRQLIGFYGDSLQSMLPGYLEMSMEAFSRNQEQMRRYMTESFGGMFPFRQLEEMGRQNMAMFEQAMSMYQPPASSADNGTEDNRAQDKEPKAAAKAEKKTESADELAELRRQLEEMRHHLDRLAGEK